MLKFLRVLNKYTLTETGISLKPILEAMKTWGEAYQMKLSQ